MAKDSIMFRLIAAMVRMTGEVAVVESVAQILRSLAIDVALASLAALSGTGVIACLAVSLWIWGREVYGPIIAPLLVAAMLALLGLAGAIAIARPRRRGYLRAQRVAAAASDQAIEPVRLIGAAARGFMQGLAGGSLRRP